MRSRTSTIAFSLAAPEGDGARFVVVTLQAAVLVAAVIASKRSRLEIGLSALVALVGVTAVRASVYSGASTSSRQKA
jgi:hypothetical protein